MEDAPCWGYFPPASTHWEDFSFRFTQNYIAVPYFESSVPFTAEGCFQFPTYSEEFSTARFGYLDWSAPMHARTHVHTVMTFYHILE